MTWLLCIVLLIVVSVMVVLLRSIETMDHQLHNRSAFLPIPTNDSDAGTSDR
ncbi:hypothetical protein [Deinococcus roseus]|uniref:Uncharacterized protein n=1 Tax=Deinococcus roseus TaxID=392414 RepID=A0ABQ2CZI4_9DEIO|nr:hypothetical protein [Deinococcus roseus]GGJ32597.1 hypothetical protein GCM10008938_18500 [Deinococcus roseus]